jgi:ferredoxin/flavodoxin---NADP+ reductase
VHGSLYATSRTGHRVHRFQLAAKFHILAVMLNAVLEKRVEVTKDLLIIRVRPDAGVPEFLPGQYVALGLPGSAPRYPGAPPETESHPPDKIIKRAYSIGSAPGEGPYLEFYVAVVPDGSLTSRLAALQPGDRLFVAPKITGTFTLESVDDGHNLLLVATGTGLAPYISMIRSQFVWTPQRQITLVHGVRLPEDLAYRDELEALSESRGDFRYIPVVSRSSDFVGLRGRVPRAFDEGLVQSDPSIDHVFLCGNPAMVEELESRLVGIGYEVHSRKTPKGKLHVEKYW